MERVPKDHSLAFELSYFCFEFVMACNVVRLVCHCVLSGLYGVWAVGLAEYKSVREPRRVFVRLRAMGMDREDTHELGRWEERKGELRAELVDKRRLTHGSFPGLRVDGLGAAMQVLGDRAEGLDQLCVVDGRA